MADKRTQNEKQSGKKNTGDRYNPVNMAGKKAGIFEEYDKQKRKGDLGRDGCEEEDRVSRDKNHKGR